MIPAPLPLAPPPRAGGGPDAGPAGDGGDGASPFPPWLGADAAPVPPTPQPRSVTELLDEGFRVLRSQYRTIAPIVAAVAIPVAVLAALASRPGPADHGSPDVFSLSLLGAWGGEGAWAIVPWLVTLFWPVLVAGPVCRVTAAHWFGRVESRRSAWKGLGRLPSAAVAVVVVDLMIAIGSLLFFLPALAVWVLFRFALPVLVVEHVGPFRAIRRSAVLVGRRFWPVLAVSVLSVVVGQAVDHLLSFVPSLLAASLGAHVGFVLVAAISVVVETVTWSWATILATLVYLDLRARSEGLDLVVRADIGRR